MTPQREERSEGLSSDGDRAGMHEASAPEASPLAGADTVASLPPLSGE